MWPKEETTHYNLSTGNRSLKRQIAVSLAFCLLFICHSAFGSLVIALYHNESMYLAGDSEITYLDSGKPVGTVRKVFKLSDNCCAALTGVVSCDLENRSGDVEFSLNLSRVLENMCAAEATNSEPLDQKMQS